MQYDVEDKEIKDAEYLILFILGKAGGKIGVLHLHKIFFTLWKFHPAIRKLVNFVPHLKGPYSFDIDELIKSPTYVSECWKFIPPGNSEAERVEGGYLIITKKGKEIYKKLVEGLNKKSKEDADALALVSAIDLIVPLYTRLDWQELLFLLYTDESNKKYSKKSELSNKILKKTETIVRRLVKKGIIPENKRDLLIDRAKSASWLK